MKPATLKALQESIRHWERIVDGTEAENGGENCPLCHRFETRDCAHPKTGEECPVLLASGNIQCRDTPFSDWRRACEERIPYAQWPYFVSDDETVMCAVLELEFLRSLLPAEEPKP